MKTLPLILPLACILFAAGCAKNSGSPTPTAPALTACSADIVEAHSEAQQSCDNANSTSQLQACQQAYSAFNTKYPNVACSAADPKTGQVGTISTAESQKSVQDASTRVNGPAPVAGNGGGSGGGQGSGPTTIVGFCSDDVTTDFTQVLDSGCPDLSTVAKAKVCQEAYINFLKAHKDINCNYQDHVSGKVTTSALTPRTLEDSVLSLQADLDALAGGPHSSLTDCSSAVAADFNKLIMPCYKAGPEDSSDIPRLKICLAGSQTFVAKYPKQLCKMPASSGSSFQVSADSIRSSIKNIQTILAL